MTLDEANALAKTMLTGTLGIRFERLEPGRVEASLEITPSVLAQNGYLHAGTIVALADTACGFGAVVTPGPGNTDFTTLNVSCNFIGTALEGTARCTATLVHGGRSTQVWDAQVSRDDGRTIAVFRATQLVLQNRRSGEYRPMPADPA